MESKQKILRKFTEIEKVFSKIFGVRKDDVIQFTNDSSLLPSCRNQLALVVDVFPTCFYVQMLTGRLKEGHLKHRKKNVKYQFIGRMEWNSSKRYED